MRVAEKLSVCGDCLQAIANGFDPDFCDWDEETAAAVSAGLARLGRHVVAGTEGEGFSWTPCDCCQRALGGERHEAALLEPSPTQAPPKPLLEQLAAAFSALANCQRLGHLGTAATWEGTLEALCREFLPSGAGFDNGSTLELEESRADRLIFATAFHHMNETGFYVGWTEHRVIVTPAFIGRFNVKVTGRDKQGIKEHIAESFGQALESVVTLPDS